MFMKYARNNRLVAVSFFIFSLALTFVLYQSTVLYLIRTWDDIKTGNYGHGYLVLAISAYLIFKNRHQLWQQQPCPNFIGLGLVFIAMSLWLVATLVSVEMLQAAALLLLIIGLLWVIFGTTIMQMLLFPVLFISFALPLWSPLSPVLQGITADVVFWLVRLFEIPAMRQENLIIVPYGTLSIEEACSGLRYLLAALTLGTLYAYINYSRLYARILVVLISAGAAILANIIRVFIIVYIAYTSNMQDPLVTNHLMMGWYLFGAVISILLITDTVVYRLQRHNNKDNAVAVIDNGQNRFDNSTWLDKPCKKTIFQKISGPVLAVILMAIAPVLIQLTPQPAEIKTTNTINTGNLLPATIDLWNKVNNENTDWNPIYNNAFEIKKTYQKNMNKVSLYIAYYATQAQGRELINEMNHISNEKIWRSIYMHAHKQQANQNTVLTQILEKNGADRKLLWYQYCVAGWCTSNKYKAKALQLLGLLNGNHEAYVVAITTNIRSDINESRKILTDFDASIKPWLPGIIKSIRNERLNEIAQ